jgi:3-deoxy-D-manno-octulosonate 8-phosphate phosphatase (KDO 8-P phosphatase)
LSEVHVGIRDKRALIVQLAERYGITLDAVAMMGDDLVDLPALRAAGLAVCPANAHASVVGTAHWQTTRTGGDGAARELADLILQAQGQMAAVLAGFGG